MCNNQDSSSVTFIISLYLLLEEDELPPPLLDAELPPENPELLLGLLKDDERLVEGVLLRYELELLEVEELLPYEELLDEEDPELYPLLEEEDEVDGLL